MFTKAGDRVAQSFRATQGNMIRPERALLLLSLVFIAFQLATLPAEPSLQPDSNSYLNFSPTRTAGYPLFLKAVGAQGAIILQPILFAASLTYLGFELVRTAIPLLLVASIIGIALSNPYLNEYHHTILTDSLFSSLLAMSLGAAIRYLRSADRKSVVAASIAVGLASALRPSGVAFLPALLLAVFMRRRPLHCAFFSVLAAAIIPAVLLMAAERLCTRIGHGSEATSLLGKHLFAKAALIDAPEQAETESNLERKRLLLALERDFLPIRDLLNQTDSALIRIGLIPEYENCLQRKCVEELRRGLNRPTAETNALLANVALQRIATAPAAFMQLVAYHYGALWVAYAQIFPPASADFRRFVEKHRPLPLRDFLPEYIVDRATPAAEQAPQHSSTIRSALHTTIRGLLLASAATVIVLSLYGLVLAGRGLKDGQLLMGGATAAAILVNAEAVFTAVFGLGLFRYVVVLWPAIVTSLGFLAAHILREYAGARRLVPA